MKQYDVIIIGGGLTGLTAALHLAANGFEILVLEKHGFPRHKVCGEYLSNEVKPYLETLDINLESAVAINHFQITPLNGRSLMTRLPLGGMGISRYCLDNLLYNKALEKGICLLRETATTVEKSDHGYTVKTLANSYFGKVVIGAYGKRDSLDKELGRPFIGSPSPWLAVKAHYTYPSWPDDLVGLFAFPGGYAGLSKTETGAVNLCYMARYSNFQSCGSIDEFNANVLPLNPILKEFFKDARMLFKKPLSIAQIPFKKKNTEEQGVLMCGDSAGLIYPLCGNGMAMAIHSAMILSELIVAHRARSYLAEDKLAKEYRSQWNATFAKRLAFGRALQALLLNSKLSALSMSMISRSPWLLNRMIRGTHGNPVLQ